MRFEKNHAFKREMQETPRYQAGMAREASRVAREARAAARTSRRTGHYTRSIGTEGNIVYTTDIAGHIIEFGSKNNVPYAPLRKGVRAAGLRFDNARRPG